MSDSKEEKSDEVDITKRPKSNKGDALHKVIKSGLSTPPIIGGPATELFSAIIAPPISKRRDEWIESIAIALKKLEEEVDGFKIENLSKDEVFITTTLNATRVAIRNHQKEKLEALRNAVLNIALENTPETDILQFFLNCVDTLTVWHLRALALLRSPIEHSKKLGIYHLVESYSAVEGILKFGFPELGKNHEFLRQIIKDLRARGLIESDSHIGDTERGIATKLGNQFLDFIQSPKELQEL